MYRLLPILLVAYGLAVTTEDIYDNSWALIIGINKYENIQNLNYAVKDAESIQEILINTFYFPAENVSLLKNDQATKQNILKSFSDITIQAKENDRVLIYFAGHGETIDLPDGGEMGYLLPVDADMDNLYLSSIGMDELKKISLMSNGKHLLYLIDACYGGLAVVGSRGLDANTTSNYINKITRNKARQIITAGGRGEQVIEKSEWGHSAFTKNLKQGLDGGNADMNGDGFITANELGLYLSEMVTIDSQNQQTPQYGRMTNQEGEFVFISKVDNIIINDNEAVNVTESNIDYDLLASKLAEKLKEDTEDSAELNTVKGKPKKQRKKRFNFLNAMTPSSQRKLSWGVDFVFAGIGDIIKQHYQPTYYITPKIIYNLNKIKLSGGIGWKNWSNKEFSFYNSDNGEGAGIYTPQGHSWDMVAVDRSYHFSIQYLAIKRLGFLFNLPITLNIDWDNIHVDTKGSNLDERFVIKGRIEEFYSIGIGTQMKNGLKIEFGIFDVRRATQNRQVATVYTHNGILHNSFHNINDYPYTYIKIGYDRLPF